jgi:tetratricopeptide (TPR) repeat protein
LLRACLVVLGVCLAAPAWGSPKTFAKADAAWHSGELEESKDLYERALAEGSLNPDDVVIAYSRIGTVKAALKETAGALSAFRIAAAIDPSFELPPDSGPKAKELYARARAEAEAQGLKLDITVRAPKSIAKKEPFSIEVDIPEGFEVMVSEVMVTLEDKAGGKAFRKSLPAEPHLSFEFPGKVAQAGVRYRVRAAAIDAQKNSWAIAETKIKVEGKASAAAKDDEEEEAMPTTWGSGEIDPFAEQDKKDARREKKKPFFQTPVGWATIGGAAIALAVGGFFVYQALTPADSVSVQAPEWR